MKAIIVHLFDCVKGDAAENFHLLDHTYLGFTIWFCLIVITSFKYSSGFNVDVVLIYTVFVFISYCIFLLCFVVYLFLCHTLRISLRIDAQSREIYSYAGRKVRGFHSTDNDHSPDSFEISI